MATLEKLNIEIKTAENAPENSKAALVAAKGAFGFTPNLLGAMANHPALLNNYWDSSASLAANSTLSGVEQQVVFLSTSYENNCHYCMAAHSTISQMHKIDQDIIDALRSGTALADAKLEALKQYTVATVTKRGRVSQEDIDAVLVAGYTQENLLEVITIVSLKVMSNYINYLGQTELDAPFQPNAWEK